MYTQDSRDIFWFFQVRKPQVTNTTLRNTDLPFVQHKNRSLSLLTACTHSWWPPAHWNFFSSPLSQSAFNIIDSCHARRAGWTRDIINLRCDYIFTTVVSVTSETKIFVICFTPKVSHLELGLEHKWNTGCG